MKATPSFTLEPCPVCSNVHHIDRPFWKFARHTSLAKRRNTYKWFGCQHASDVIERDKLRDDPDDWAMCEDAWNAAAAQLFDAHTAGWTEKARDAYRHTLRDRPKFPGAIEQLNFDLSAP